MLIRAVWFSRCNPSRRAKTYTVVLTYAARSRIVTNLLRRPISGRLGAMFMATTAALMQTPSIRAPLLSVTRGFAEFFRNAHPSQLPGG